MAVQLATDYCNLCDLVIAPSESIARLLADRGVTTRLETVPTGIDATAFASGNGSRYRMDAKIPESAPVIGHIGRLAGEKNLAYLAEAVMEAMRGHPDSHFLLVGDGDAREEMVSSFENAGLSERLHAPGKQMGRELADAYAAMDCFVFASQTETQGIVLAEAMAAGAPVIALDGSGVREIVDDGVNGRLLSAGASSADFSAAIIRLLEDPDCRRSMSERAKESARRYDTATCTRRMLGHYAALLAEHRLDPPHDATAWDRMIAGIEIEWELLAAKVSAVTAAVVQTPATEASFD